MGHVLNLEFDLQPEILPEGIEITIVPKAPKAKESRRKKEARNPEHNCRSNCC